MANFSIQANIQVLPLEEITFTDTTQKAKGIHSSIDRSFSATSTAELSTTAANVAAYTITMTANQADDLSTLLGLAADGVAIVFIKILSPVASQQVRVEIKAQDGAGTEYAYLYVGAQQNFMYLNTGCYIEDIALANHGSSSSTLEILLGKVTL